MICVTVDGPVTVGTTGRLKPTGGPGVPFTITVADEPRRCTDVWRLPLARMTFDHRLVPHEADGTQLTHEVTITGALSGCSPG